MSWKKAMIVEKALAEALASKEGIGTGMVYDGETGHCVIGKGLEALGVSVSQYRNIQACYTHSGITAWDMAVAFGGEDSSLKNFAPKLKEVVSINDGYEYGGWNDTAYTKNQPLAAELLVSAIKEFVPDDEDNAE